MRLPISLSVSSSSGRRSRRGLRRHRDQLPPPIRRARPAELDIASRLAATACSALEALPLPATTTAPLTTPATELGS